MRMIQLIGAVMAAIAFAAPASAASVTEQEAYEIGVDAYVYAYPLVTMELTRRQMTNVAAPGAAPGRGPVNALVHLRAYPDASYRDVVRPNFDTLYSLAWIDLRQEPMIISVPDNKGRYYLLPLLDMWTDVFAVPGSRTSGDGPRHIAVVAPGWRGELPANVERIEAPTPVVLLAGRTQTNGVADYEAVHAFQDGMRLAPLSRFGKDSAAVVNKAIDPSVDMLTPPMKQVNGLAPAAFFRTAAQLMALHHPHGTDHAMLARLKRIGLEPGRPFELDQQAPEVQRALARAAPDGLKLLAGKLARLAPRINGWMMPVENVGTYGNGYLPRASIALVGLGANPPEDSVYAMALTDGDGKPLHGGSRYVIQFARDQLPPARAFWSVTLYDNDGFPVANTQKRYAVGDLGKQLTYNGDGSLTLYLQGSSPGPGLDANWLPTSPAPFNLTLRAYHPKAAMLTGGWQMPAIRKVD